MHTVALRRDTRLVSHGGLDRIRAFLVSLRIVPKLGSERGPSNWTRTDIGIYFEGAQNGLTEHYRRSTLAKKSHEPDLVSDPVAMGCAQAILYVTQYLLVQGSMISLPCVNSPPPPLRDLSCFSTLA